MVGIAAHKWLDPDWLLQLDSRMTSMAACFVSLGLWAEPNSFHHNGTSVLRAIIPCCRLALMIALLGTLVNIHICQHPIVSP
jgi:hypothetical protein